MKMVSTSFTLGESSLGAKPSKGTINMLPDIDAVIEREYGGIQGVGELRGHAPCGWL